MMRMSFQQLLVVSKEEPEYLEKGEEELAEKYLKKQGKKRTGYEK